MTMPLSRRCAMLVAPVVAVGASLALAAPASALSTDVVISEVYGGGGNAGATLRNDFVELFNRSDAPVDVTGWVVRYFSSGGGAGGTATLSGTIAPHRNYLVQMAAGTGGTADLPTPDAVGTAGMSATAGRVDVTAPAGLVDRVAYGATTASPEGTAAPGLTNTTSATRSFPCADTDNNGMDFSEATPAPENSATATPTCTVAPPPVVPRTIEEVQGAAHLSPLNGQKVADVKGVVTVVSRNGFWMQSTTPDDDIATAEGLFVFTGAAPTAVVGDAVSVAGRVTEFRPGGAGGNDNTTTTELTGVTVTVESSGNRLPKPVVIGQDRVAPQQVIEAGNPLNVEYATAPFRPTVDAIDFYESLEGTLVAVRDAQVVGPTASFGEIPVVPSRKVDATRSRAGGVVYGGYDQPNAMRLQLDDLLIGRAAMPDANVGDRLVGLTTGVVDYSFSNYKVLVTAPPVVTSGGVRRETTDKAKSDELAVATFNVENLAPQDPQTKFDRLAGQVVGNLRSPDVLALEEIQDNSGATNDGVVDSTATTDKLIAAITAAGGPAYRARWVNPAPGNTDGGAPGGNIRQVFLFRPDRGVAFVDTPGGDATTPITVVTDPGGRPHLSASPGRINPASPAWASSRKPLAAEFTFRGQTVFAIANHFASKGGDDPLFGRWQQPVRGSEEQRHQQAQEVRGFVDQLLAADAKAKVVVLGDINDFEFSQTADILVGSGATAMTDLPRTLPASERYTYVYEGNSQVLDHILLSPGLVARGHGDDKHGDDKHGDDRRGDSGRDHGGRDDDRGDHGKVAYDYDIVHTNSPFVDQDSDHDPQIVRLSFTR